MKCLIYCLRLSEKHDHSIQSQIYTSVQNTLKWVMLPLALTDNELICDLTLNSIIGKGKKMASIKYISKIVTRFYLLLHQRDFRIAFLRFYCYNILIKKGLQFSELLMGTRHKSLDLHMKAKPLWYLAVSIFFKWDTNLSKTL